MGKIYDTIDSHLAAWIQRQKIFFVASAPLSPDAHVNCSPKGGDTLRISGAKEVAYLDLTGSGIETVAHVQENGRIVVMFCAFEGPPKIVRLHGRAAVLYPNDPEFERFRAFFPMHAGARAIVKVSVSRISDSCGYAVPRFAFVEQRDVLDKWTARKSSEELVAYRVAKNTTSIDGLPGHKPA
jgi:hypothetical protein